MEPAGAGRQRESPRRSADRGSERSATPRSVRASCWPVDGRVAPVAFRPSVEVTAAGGCQAVTPRSNAPGPARGLSRRRSPALPEAECLRRGRRRARSAAGCEYRLDRPPSRVRRGRPPSRRRQVPRTPPRGVNLLPSVGTPDSPLVACDPPVEAEFSRVVREVTVAGRCWERTAPGSMACDSTAG